MRNRRLANLLVFGIGACSLSMADTLTPNEAVREALAHNRLIKIAALEVDKSRSTIATARTRLLPQISLAADEGMLLSPLTLRIPKGSLGDVPGLGAFPTQDTDIKTDPKPTTLATLTIGQPLSQIPRIKLGIQLAKEQTAFTEEVLRQRRHETTDTVRSACYDLAQAQAAKTAADAAVAYADEAVRAATAAVASGAVLDQTRMEAVAKREAAAQQAQTFANAVESARMRLNQLMGRVLDAPLEIDVAADPPPEVPTREEVGREAIAHRPEVKQAERKLNMARLALRIRRRQDDPDVSLMLTAAKTYSIDVLPEPVVMLGLHVTWEPVDWGRKRSELEARSADVQEAELGVEEARSQVALDADVRFRTVADRQAALSSAESALAAARERQRVVGERLKAGAALPKDKLEADYLAAQTEAAVVEAKSQLATAFSALTKAMGKD